MAKVAHLTSVHSIDDPRIFFKECISLAAAGFEVTLIAPHHGDELRQGVRVRAVPRPGGRTARITRTIWQIYRAAASSGADLFHIHDPELIGIGVLLRLHGREVVYDVHEDYVTSIRQKDYLPRLLRAPLSVFFEALERLAASWFRVILAERYYVNRFPGGTLVLNYPRREMLPSRIAQAGPDEGPVRLLYTGVVSEDRGALIHAGLVGLDDEFHVHIIGRCDVDLAARMRRASGASRDRLYITGEGAHVPYHVVLEAYERGGWTAGLALFPDTPHYRNKQLTKFFEYMAAGIPIICSNFPEWATLVSRTGCGFCVDPRDTTAVRDAIGYLIEHPTEAAEMGRRGQKAVDTRFNWTREEETLVSFYRDALGIPLSSVGVPN